MRQLYSKVSVNVCQISEYNYFVLVLYPDTNIKLKKNEKTFQINYFFYDGGYGLLV